MSLFNVQMKLKITFLIIIFMSIIIFIYFLIRKNIEIRNAEIQKLEEIAKGPLVHTAKILKSPAEREIIINGETRPYQSVTLYSKISGYLKKINVDKGDIVKKGQILAVIESPVTDEAYLAALANFKNKDLIAKRAIQLQKENLVSIQEKDQAVSDSDIARAQLNAQKILKSYETIRAPFDGTITARFADMGALVQNAENSQNSALPIVTISDINKLVVNIFLDQNDAPFIQKNDPVKIEVTIQSIKQISGNINRINSNLDQKTKMMLVEVDIPNKEKFLVSGSFVKVYIKVKSQAYYILPVESLIMKKDKSFVALINNQNKVHFKQINLENNDGKIIGFQSDVNEGDLVIINPGSELNEGTLIRPIFDPK